MLKSELIQRIVWLHPHLTSGDASKVANAILEAITAALAGGKRVEIRGFGAFSIKERAANVGRDPRTGAPIKVASKRVVYFKPGKEMRARLNLADA